MSGMVYFTSVSIRFSTQHIPIDPGSCPMIFFQPFIGFLEMPVSEEASMRRKRGRMSRLENQMFSLCDEVKNVTLH